MANVIAERERNLYSTFKHRHMGRFVIKCGLKPGKLAQDYRVIAWFAQGDVEVEQLRDGVDANEITGCINTGLE